MMLIHYALLAAIYWSSLATSSHAISIKPADFERLIMPCYLGGGGGYGGSYGSGYSSSMGAAAYSGGLPSQNPALLGLPPGGQQVGGRYQGSGVPLGRSEQDQTSAYRAAGAGVGGGGGVGPGYQPQQPSYFGGGVGAGNPESLGRFGPATNGVPQSVAAGGGPSISQFNVGARQDNLSNLGQQIPRAASIDNFIALVGKIEAAHPRLAHDPDQLIRMLLGRFRMDNYYYDVRSRTAIGEQDHKNQDITPALLAGSPSVGYGQPSQTPQSSFIYTDVFPEHVLDQDEKCSMYFMLSHFIDRTMPYSPPLASQPVSQLTGPLGNQRPPVLQAADARYPAQSADQAFSGNLASATAGAGTGVGAGAGAGGVGVGSSATSGRYPGPNPSFGSPATSGMTSFGAGLSNQPDYTGRNPYGMNSLQQNPQYNQNLNLIRNSGPYSGTSTSNLAANNRYATPYLDGGASRSRDEKQAIEYGVVTVGNQENAALVLNRVLMGILAAGLAPQTVRNLASVVYATQNSPPAANRLDEELDPLYAVTLADLWALSALPKAGKPNDIRMLGVSGHWNDTMCPTSFLLDRASSIRFTTAELLGGLDGFSLGMFRRRMMSLRKRLRLSEMLKIYYSRDGFRPQFAEVGVCNRASAISTQLDDLRRQAENYLRLYQLNMPTSDNDIAVYINRVDYFKEVARQAASQLSPPEVCLEPGYNEGGLSLSGNPNDQCEVARADLITVLDSSPDANEAFMNLVVMKLASRIGLSRAGSTLSILTNQQDTTGYAGSYSFNAILRNSTNTAEVGCALKHDSTRTYQGSQISEPTRLIEMFEQALVNIDSEYLIRQRSNSGYSSSTPSSITNAFSSARDRQSSYTSSLYGSSGGEGIYNYLGGSQPRNIGGSKVIIWFNYGSQGRPSSLSGGPTNWDGGPRRDSGSSDNEWRFGEAKKYLRENFRGASILAVSPNRDAVKQFVYNEDRDIFTEVPPGNSVSGSALSGPSGTGDFYSYSSQTNDPATLALLSGPADQLVSKLMARMCEIPAMFQYPMCFRAPSENAMSVGYISPGRKQLWMMSPKTFFASRSVRMVFKVEGGRLNVCFGRMPRPDESAARGGNQYQSGSVYIGSASQASYVGGDSSRPGYAQSAPNPTSTSPRPAASSSDYYTGMEYGVCKEVSPGQEIDFLVSDPCWKKSISECEPFYFVINELSHMGETDVNYMCTDEGCKRFDQVKFVVSHTGVSCSSAFKSVQASWLLVVLSIVATFSLSNPIPSAKRGYIKHFCSLAGALVAMICYLSTQQVDAQQAGVHDFGQGRYGEKRGNLTPGEVLAIILLVMTIAAGLALTAGLCYYYSKRKANEMKPVEQDDY